MHYSSPSGIICACQRMEFYGVVQQILQRINETLWNCQIVALRL
jgi:hypothetical protein